MAKNMGRNSRKTADLSKPWFEIDNAANLYAGARSRDWCRTYRTALVLDEEIDPAIMQKALEDTAKRFPYFCAKLRDGLFWSYFERVDSVPVLVEDTDYPYRPILIEGSDQPNFRILYYKNRLVIEAFHSISDGGGSNVFLCTLVGRYYELKGESVPKTESVLDVNEAPLECETVDDYKANADKNAKAKNVAKADIYLGENNAEKNFVQLIHGIMKSDDVVAAAKKHSLTVTEYFTALIIYTFVRCADGPIDKPVSVSVPIDLRKRFNSSSLRNFVYMTDVTFEPSGRTDIEFSEICDSIRGKLAGKATREYLVSSISANVAAQETPVIRVVPYAFKKVFLKNSYKKSQQTYTTFFSNLGVFRFPEPLSKHVVRAESCLAFTPHMHFGCACATVNGVLTYTFSSSNRDTEKQKFFFRFLTGEGVPVRIESNIYE